MKPIYLYVVPFFPSSKSWRGGFFYDAVKALMRDGRYDIKVMSTATKEDYDIDGIHVYGVGSCKIGDSDYFSTLTDFFKLRLFAKKLKAMGFSPRDVAVCHVHLLERLAIYAQWMKKKNKHCLTLVHHHWTGDFLPQKTALHWLFPFENEIAYIRRRCSYKSVDVHLFCSEMTKEGFGKVYQNGLDDKPKDIREYLKCSKFLKPLEYKDAKVVYNGIDTSYFKPNSLKCDTSLFKIGCVANFIESKGQSILIEAFAQMLLYVPQAKLFLVGSGASLAQCKARSKELNIEDKVVFLTEYPHTEIVNFYQSLDLYVLPSYWEAFNCSLIEAHGCGVPVITTDVISFKEVLNEADQKQWLVPAKDVETLAKKLLWAYNEKPQPQILTKNLNIEDVIKAFLDWVDFQMTMVK